jgi:hypothetical protein
MKLLVYVPLLTPRIKYIFSFIFNDVLKTQVGFSSNLEECKQSALPKITYANQPIGGEVFFKNADLLLGHSISPPNIKTAAFGDMIVPFAVEGSTLPFDVFAAAFYFISRYEEYLPHKQSVTGTYPVELSLQNKLKLLTIPVIDAWALILKNILLKKYPDLFFGKKQFEFVPLICMYPSNRHEKSTFMEASRNLIKKITSLVKKDAADEKAIEFQESLKELNEVHQVKGMFFFKPPQQTDHECDGDILLPGSYLQLIKAGTNNDYRMGYSHTPGFRAGTCTPFHWYDLQLEKTTHLLIHPLTVNNLSLRLDKHFRLQDAIYQWQNLLETVKLLEGRFYMLWHQDLLKEDGKEKSAIKLYKEMLANSLSLPYDIRPK